MQREDTQPWYRQFWPWFIMAIPAAAVVAGLTTVWISMQTSDSLVIRSDDGIQAGAERQIAAERLAMEMGLAAFLEVNADSGAISVVMRSGQFDNAPEALELELSHPAFADRDQFVTLIKAMPDAAGNPVWSGHLVTVPKGRWYVVLKSGDDWRLSAEWHGESQLLLRPPSATNDNGT